MTRNINANHIYILSVKRARGRRRRRPPPPPPPLRPPRSLKSKSRKLSLISGKLQALKKLIPSSPNTAQEIISPDQLFQQTANYILLLRTRVLILQNLIHFYATSSSENEIHAVS